MFRCVFIQSIKTVNRITANQASFTFRAFSFAHNKLLNKYQNHMKMSENSKEIVIGTHSGAFHCDEILACYMLKQLPKYQNAQVKRSRDAAVLNECDIVVDVGGVFDAEKLRFDHHQRTFEHTLGTLKPEYAEKFSKVRLSSAGLIYTYFGEEVIRNVLNASKNTINDAGLRKVFEKVYEGLIQEIDGIDNGVAQYSDEPIYRITTHLSARVGHYNSQWNSTDDYDEQQQFEKAMALVGSEFVDCVTYYANVWWPARAIVDDAIKKRFEIHSSGKIIELEQFCPWKHHLYELEKENKCDGEILYCIFASTPNDNRVICVPNTPSSFVCRKFLPTTWRGVRDDDLATMSGVSGARFCHATGFIGGGAKRDDVLQMAIKSVEYTEKPEN